MCKRGDIYYVNFGEKDGSKQGGVRPALVVSNNKANKHSPVVTVVPLSEMCIRDRDRRSAMSGRVNALYGLNQGDRIMVTRGKEKKKAAVVKEYPFHILMDWGKYRSSVNKVDVYTGDEKLARI